MSRRATLAASLVALISLGGCSWFSSEDDKKTEVQAVVTERTVPVESIRDIEVGRTRDGIAVTAHGLAPGLGYGAPELRARRDGQPGPDGILDFDFVAQAPDPGFSLGTGTVQARAIRADLLLTPRDIEGARGIRVHAASGGIQMLF